ncbi:FAD-dependent oxidoreductase, partial [bacterium]
SLIAHVEREGVHYVEGGMARLAEALVALAEARGVTISYGHRVTSVECARDGVQAVHVETPAGGSSRRAADVIVYAGDVGALARGFLGDAVRKAVDYDYPPAKRSLSALTLSALARTSGFPLVRHNVFFAEDGKAEFDDLFSVRRLPRHPTVYVCAQDRTDTEATPDGAERLFFIVNAPADADVRPLHEQDLLACERALTSLLERSGLTLDWEAKTWTTPTDFENRFPGSQGALYGRTSHGMLAALSRPSARSKLRGLYLAGGSVHPGAGVPMAALSGRSAARAIEADSASSGLWRRAATDGSTSTA